MHAQPNGPHELCGKLPGANILDATPENINDYCCGSWDLVVRDVEATLPAALACEVLAELARQRVPEAFALRLELVCLKKIAYYLFAQGSSLERQLAQLATFWHGEHLGGAEGAACGYWRHSARLTEVSDARVQCSGAVSATADARALVKHLCCLPRHSSKGCGALLLELPRSLHCWRLVERACAAASAPPPTAADEPPPAAVAGRWHSRLRESLGVQLWPPEAAAVVRASLLCRGADKALRAAVAASGWPAHIADRRGAVREKAADNKLCSGCGAQFSALWPVYGKHGCDEELLALLWTHGAPPGIEVRHVKKGEAKGAALREGLRPGDTALLVDDSIAELVHPSVTGDCGAEAGEESYRYI
ncbi:hypothetical protein EMIHUDRAFT_214676 [Emiliania huxleyi CCMP1516]|uniref:Uncharacterized protein n=2 Tax=Emiliania huxleyi TaxID=2903 RepID=A0A0D3IJB2_EMIH1|nr:hypothetical protein EMIHUDRAFT_214676 [Emiliania huxleyi CCMP1516]EOD11347.1 hypothetical protein EMIHUDRAFT_214676 [Emiliania huxleyi CCMP1516]|eukprot:XP_005763776.1 hypothetical protein EMIHUDRAFT_214676 [Emiliania huxleyi CCMP1516]